MSVLFFSTVDDIAAQGVQAIIRAEVWPDQIEICRSVKALAQRLHRPRGDLAVAVVNVSSSEELAKVSCLKDLMDDLATILILPDINPNSITRAHEMRPRFLASTDCNPVMIAGVLAKILRKHKERIESRRGR